VNDFKVGDRAVYDEDGHYILVEVLEVNSTDKEWAFRLKAIRTVDEFRGHFPEIDLVQEST
jgi:hypothetical protein